MKPISMIAAEHTAQLQSDWATKVQNDFKDNKINITDAMIYLVDDWLEPQVLLKCLDEMNYYTLTTSMKSKHQLLNKNTGMDEFLI